MPYTAALEQQAIRDLWVPFARSHIQSSALECGFNDEAKARAIARIALEFIAVLDPVIGGVPDYCTQSWLLREFATAEGC